MLLFFFYFIVISCRKALQKCLHTHKIKLTDTFYEHFYVNLLINNKKTQTMLTKDNDNNKSRKKIV